MNGWIKLYRQFRDWEWYQDSNMVHLYIHMLLKANREPRKWKGVQLETGQFIGGRKTLSLETGISARTIRTCISRLSECGLVTSKSTNKYTVFTLVKWRSHANGDNINDQQDAHTVTSNRPATDQQPTTNKSIENYKNEKKGTNVPKEKASRIRSLEWDQEFDIFWNLCPKKKSKEQARKAWHKMRRNKSCTMPPEEVAQLYRKHYDSQRDSQYAQHPGTWLNAMGYEDEEPEQQQQPAATDPKGRPLPPGFTWDNDLYGIRNQFGYQVGEDMVEQEWRKLGNEEKAQKWVHVEPNWEMV